MHQKKKKKKELSRMFGNNLLLSYFGMTLLFYVFTDAHKTRNGAVLFLERDFKS